MSSITVEIPFQTYPRLLLNGWGPLKPQNKLCVIILWWAKNLCVLYNLSLMTVYWILSVYLVLSVCNCVDKYAETLHTLSQQSGDTHPALWGGKPTNCLPEKFRFAVAKQLIGFLLQGPIKHLWIPWAGNCLESLVFIQLHSTMFGFSYQLQDPNPFCLKSKISV